MIRILSWSGERCCERNVGGVGHRRPPSLFGCTVGRTARVSPGTVLGLITAAMLDIVRVGPGALGLRGGEPSAPNASTAGTAAIATSYLLSTPDYPLLSKWFATFVFESCYCIGVSLLFVLPRKYSPRA